MSGADETGVEHWRRVLRTGGSTQLPRWVRDPLPGVGEHEVALPQDLAAAVRTLADDLAVPVGTVVLAAHARVLAALSGETDVVTGYAVANVSEPLPCPLSAGQASWRDLVADVARAEADLLAHADVAVDALRRELDVPGPVSDAVIDLSGAGGDLPGGAVVRLDVVSARDGLGLRLLYRTDAVDPEHATRVLGYHLAALAAAAAEPDVSPARRSLVSPEERHLQVDGLAGPRRALPDRRVHELVEEQVRAHPDAVAVVRGDESWTYRELNTRANRLARALLSRGLSAEGVVAVVTERNLPWAAAVLAVLKAGGAYLPIEPGFPAERIARVLVRAGCRVVLTEAGSTGSLDAALASLPGVERLLVEDLWAEERDDTDLGVAVTADRLAYLYFTSGSTGEPKGAMCEQAGMLNHLLAKIADLGVGEGSVVAQTAPQCFDISLWQLVSALLVGGRTLIVEQEDILDVERFVETVVAGRVDVLQLVPSYLEVVLTYLERCGRALPDLRVVSATGEALKAELAQRFFAVLPGVALVNAYGLTETSDDTNHHVMREAPPGARVPLGRPVQNVRVYVVDDELQPVPLGAPGIICFSGVCVGRGYVNDPERTAQAYLDDPHRPGERLYRGGDYGRWLPDGTLDFLGRRDSQVKVAGFRIEIGEVENALLRVPGVRDGAVVVADRPDGGKRLVAFHSGRQWEPELLRRRLAAALPAYMVPAAFHWRECLPLTANGKIDSKALTALAAGLGATQEDVAAPRTPTERRLAAAWAPVLGVPADSLGRRDSFFDRGGTSLTAVRLVIALDRVVTLGDLTRHPVLADLAELIDARAGSTTPAPATVPSPRTSSPLSPSVVPPSAVPPAQTGSPAAGTAP